MKKIILCFVLLSVMVINSACTRQVVFLNKDINTVKISFDNFVKSTGYSYRIKDDVNNIYNVDIGQYNMQYLLQSKPIISYNMGFTCKFKALGNDTLLDFKTYPQNQGVWDYRRFLKEQRWENVQYVSYKKYKKEHHL